MKRLNKHLWCTLVLALAVAGVAQAESCPDPRPNGVTVDGDLYLSMMENFSDLLSGVRALPVDDQKGVRVFGIKATSLFRKVGLCNEDVIQRVDQEPIPDVTKLILTLFPRTRQRGESTVIELLRSGQPVILRYAVDKDIGYSFFQRRAQVCKSIRKHAPQRAQETPSQGQSSDGSFRYVEFFKEGEVVGLVIYRIRKGSNAAKISLRRGDIVLSVNDRPICSSNELEKIESALSTPNVANVVVLRKGQQMRLP